MSLRPDQLPQTARLCAYALAVGILLYLTLAPADVLPSPQLWDKAKHGLAWLVLTGLGLGFWPDAPRRVSGFALAIGALVEVLQSLTPFGRAGDLRDLTADAVGVAAALLGWAAIRWFAAGRPLRA